MRYKIAICDDTEEDANYIAAAVHTWAEKENILVNTDTFPSGESFLFQYGEQKDYDILLLDIEMNDINGVELAKIIRNQNDTVQIIFITGFSDFIAEGYEVSALHYLMKPVMEEKLFQVLNRAVKKIEKAERSVVFSANGETRRTAVSEIICVEAFAHSCMVTTAGSSFEVKWSISAIEKMLSEAAEGEFIRCHRSYLVGIRFIKSISKTDITLDTQTKIPLSRKHYKEVNKAFIRYFKGESQWDS